jgi:hypothetical protein
MPVIYFLKKDWVNILYKYAAHHVIGDDAWKMVSHPYVQESQ